MPTFSVVIPTRNRPASIVHCLDALANQDFAPETFEVIVVDDGSETSLNLDTNRWIGRLEIRLIRQDNSGPGGARNRGVQEATGVYLAFTDDDCVPTKSWLSELHSILRDHPNALVGGTTFNGLKDRFFSEVSQSILGFVYEHFNKKCEDAYFFTSNNMGCRRSDFLSIGGFDSTFQIASEDRELCSRWRQSGRSLFWRKAALVEHRHAQDFYGFVRLHFRYGQGALKYQKSDKTDTPSSLGSESSFHLALPKLILRRLRGESIIRGIGIIAALVLWQVVYLAGYLYEVIRNQIRKESLYKEGSSRIIVGKSIE